MSKQIERAYKEFLKQEQKRKAKMNSKMTASSGLLARRTPPVNRMGQADQIDTIISFVDEIRKFGGVKQNG